MDDYFNLSGISAENDFNNIEDSIGLIDNHGDDQHEVPKENADQDDKEAADTCGHGDNATGEEDDGGQ